MQFANIVTNTGGATASNRPLNIKKMIHETYTAKEIAKEYFADGILWDLPEYKSCIEGDKLKVTTPDGVEYFNL